MLRGPGRRNHDGYGIERPRVCRLVSRRASHGESESGRVVAAFGRRVLIEDAAGERHRCMITGRRLRPVCGDEVQWARPVDDSDGLVTAIEPRRNELARPSRRGRNEVLAANIDQLLIVSAPIPAPDPFIVDRYIAAARLMDAAAGVVCNKSDLVEASQLLDPEEFRRIGYPVIDTSARTGAGLDELRRLMAAHTNILVGQSGVGKSSLLNALLPHVGAETAAVSAATGEGRHTTTASVLHHLASGGTIIDSPGVRDFAPPSMEPSQVATGFAEIAARAGECRFANCMHLQEPDCAVKTALAQGAISPRRYESYRRLYRLMTQLKTR